MGMTIAEKIIAAAAGVESVRPGDIHTVNLDKMMSNDGTTHLTVDMYNNQLKHPHIADPKKLVFIVDHNVPSDNPKTAAIPIILHSAIPQSICLSGNSFLKIPVLVASARSASRTTTSSCSLPSSTRA